VTKYSLFLLLFVLNACNASYSVSNVADQQQKFDASYTFEDPVIEAEILPYRRELEASMNELLAVAAQNLTKAKPESTLGNLLADASLEMAEIYTGKKVDVGIINYGGIRVPSISKGNVSLGNVYELMPFDNYLVTLSLEGKILEQVLQKIASGGGWPVTGIQFTIKEGKAVNIKINGKAINDTTIYVVAISDYLANGGDNLEMLKGLAQNNTDVLLRDAFIDYFKAIHAEGQLLDAVLENRISNE
jgi:2',3'-cyclic-nucleotide 2'-phosphodiesterase (5'-nucleotidase family)